MLLEAADRDADPRELPVALRRYNAVVREESSDAEIVARSIDDPALFRVLFDRHLPAIYRYARHCVGAQAAEDLAAETFVRAFSARAGSTGPGANPRAWLFVIATNLIRDEARRRRREGALVRRISARRASALAPADAPDPELTAAVSRLRTSEREVLLLFAWGELTYEEIAAATGTAIGTAIGTVRSRLSRARARLRADLGESWPAGDDAIDGARE